jgi:hypothetical protein
VNSVTALVAVLIPIVLAGSAFPQRQAAQLRRIEGSVRDRTEAVIPDTNITVESSSTTEPLTAKTNGYGTFSVELAEGLYRVCAKREGFVEKCLRASVNSGTNTKISFVLSVVPQQPEASSKLLDDALRKEAGSAAKNCGHVRINDKSEKASQCVIQQFRNHRPFLVRYDLWGVDSEVALGLAGSPDRVRAFLFDSFGTSREGAPKNAMFLSDNHVVAVPCPAPVELHVSGNGRITCFGRDGEGKWLGLEDFE